MEYVFGGLLGLALGCAAAFINTMITRVLVADQGSEVKPMSSLKVLLATILRYIVSALALLAVFLARNALPIPFYAVIAGTAIGLTVGSFIMLWIMLKKK